ncbi:HXXEE domain-containing protein [bacterium]|nr:MAG: HXXEE domain-containing protein [bacterium]
MQFSLLSWLFAVALTIHNLEEAVFMPRWQPPDPRLSYKAGPKAFRFAIVVITALAFIAVYLAQVRGRESFGAYFVTGFALAMLVNVLFPHTLISLRFRCYCPGVVSAVLLILPVTALLLYASFTEGWVVSSKFIWAGPLVVVCMLALLPLLFLLGRLFFGKEI